MKEIKKLEEKILHHKRLYYQGKPEISDFEYDSLEDELRKIAPKSYVLESVGSDVFNTEKIPHDRKMLSLGKTYKEEELLRWMGDHQVVSTFKIDGSSCSLIYREGRLTLGKTRGDGRFGENITEKILFIPNVPRVLKEIVQIEVRGEIFCTEENFIKLANEMRELGLEPPTSQRNIVAGILGRRENIALARFLTFQAFELLSDEVGFDTEQEKFHYLNENNFETPLLTVHPKKNRHLEQTLDEAQNFMSEGNYLIDGLVFTYDKISLHEELGATAHHPRYKMAYKFQGESKTTDIESISWQVSRNGVLTPVANVVPVELSGAKVSRVTLHNYGMVREFQLKSGDTIEIVRSGEVIPKFLSVVSRGEGKFTAPSKCPSCKELVKEVDIRLVCDNDLCPDKVKDDILNFIKKIGIDDLSSKRLEELIRLGLVTDIPSLYELTEEKLLTVEKVKEKLATKILGSIKKSLNADLTTFLSALGLNGGAYNKCDKIVQAGYDNIQKILNLTVSDLVSIDSFAELSSKSLVDSIQAKKPMITKLMTYGFKLDAHTADTSSGVLAGKKFCITGTLSMKRSELEKIVKANGAQVQSSVSKETDYLLTNDTESSSSKFKKAQTLGTPIINEEKFFDIIGK